MSLLAISSGSAWWYLARGTGAVSLLLLTAVMALGLAGPLRASLGRRLPRVAVETLHRDLSLLAILLIVVHVVSSVADGFAPITLLDAVIPFGSAYRPLWLGFGALAFDLMVALALTSLVRRRLGYGAWRAVHMLAFLSWPVAVLHGLGTGSDQQTGWMIVLTAVCVAVVTATILVRLARAAAPGPARGWGIGLTLAAVIASLAFALQGPLHSGWARRAGTPASLLPHSTGRHG